MQDENGWKGIGDTVDVALLTAARKAGLAQDKVAAEYPLIARISYEPDLKYAASFSRERTRAHLREGLDRNAAQHGRPDGYRRPRG
ncbi:hypothetical protein [Rhizobium lentis]|uniref:hypothetical protein n=1 Tax=Rhizobium lentis TaxID=1138194 RepID=UPI0035C8C5FA